MSNRIHFDFKDDRTASKATLEFILCSDHWSDRLPLEDDYTEVLIYLLHYGGMEVHEETYTAREFSMEVWQREQQFAHMMGKRNSSAAVREIMERFAEPDPGKRIHNALFFSNVRAYIRCSGLPAEHLFQCFEDGECDQVILFPESASDDGEYAFYSFRCAEGIQREKLTELLDSIRNRKAEELREAIERANENSPLSKVIPFPEIE